MSENVMSRPWDAYYFGRVLNIIFDTKTKLHALHQLGAFVHELLLGNGCLLIDLQIHGSDPLCSCSGRGGCSGRGADANGEVCTVRDTP